MLKTSLLVLGGLVAGLAIALWLQPSSQPAASIATRVGDSTSAVRSAPTDARADERLVALEDALDTEILQRAALEERVAELASQLEALGERPAFARELGGAGPGQEPPANMREIRAREQAERRGVAQQADRRFVDQLVAEGFAPDRAEWLVRRTEELRMQALQAQYDAQRSGRPVDPAAGMQSLRTELGDTDYERYLKADGRPTAVPVRDVLASSPAERSGLQPGDEIVAYAGKRVFDMRELNALTLEGTPGESVVVDVRRDGQNVQLVMPRGPIGIFGGGFRGR
jgi:PDZ domain